MAAFKMNQFIHESVTTFQDPVTSRYLNLYINPPDDCGPVLLNAKPASLLQFHQQFNLSHIKDSKSETSHVRTHCHVIHMTFCAVEYCFYIATESDLCLPKLCCNDLVLTNIYSLLTKRQISLIYKHCVASCTE
jgi:hypothetical protein